MKRLTILASALALTCTAAGLVRAHDFWIQPDAFVAAKDQLLRLKLFVGHGFDVRELGRNPEHVDKFFSVGADSQKKPVAGRDGHKPAGYVRLPDDGLHVLAYESKASALELPPRRFESYLEEEGLETVIEQRAERGETKKAGRESYSRCAKALVASEKRASEGFDRVVGLPLEIVPRVNPYTLEAGKPLAIEIRYRGQPIEGVLVAARDHRGREISARSDRSGRVELALPHRGFWLVAAVHMVRAQEDSKADWRSYWASLTFDNS